jgi:hypothetical protein
VSSSPADRHRRAADTHSEAADRHEKAAEHWNEEDDQGRAALERRNAEIERAAKLAIGDRSYTMVGPATLPVPSGRAA